MRNIGSRILRLQWVAFLGFALAALPAVASSSAIGTFTTLNVATSDQNGRTQAAIQVSVTGEDGQPASGVVAIEDGTLTRAEAALDASGHASSTVTLSGGDHQLRAVYLGDATHQESKSPVVESSGTPTGQPGFDVSIAPVSPTTFPMTLTAGQTGTSLITVTPESNSLLTAPMFVTLSCSGLPNESSCTFTPNSIEIVATTPASCTSGSPASSCPPTSSMLLETQAAGSNNGSMNVGPGANLRPIAWALLLPGVLGLGGFVFGGRRRAFLNRMALVALVGVVMSLGMSGCSPLYRYYNHGPGQPPATPSGTYTVTITAQSNNGVTSIASTTTVVLTVN
ncbi:MAG: Ig-like domain-containing protein [Terracidiphilus sp.]